MSTTPYPVGNFTKTRPDPLSGENSLPPVAPAREAIQSSLPTTRHFEQLYESWYDAIFQHLSRLLGNREQAEDAAQETFLKVWRALPRFEARSNPKPWLFRIATNTAYDLLRRRRILSWVLLDDLDHELGENTSSDPQERYLVAEPVEILRRALISMRPQDRAIVAYKGEGFSIQEIGLLMHTSPGAAKTRLFRARARLREAFNLPSGLTASGVSRL